MTWTTFHRRGEVLRTVIEAADARRDGRLPTDLPGVTETFDDELALLGALQLRWHTRLSGHLERALMQQPLDIDGAAVAAWHATAEELPGVRMVLDRYRAEPLDERMGAALATSAAKEHVLLAAMAGRAGTTTAATAAAGRLLEERARVTYRPAPPPKPVAGHRGGGLFARVRARVAA
ncbi:MAG TPA: hypothetical protein VGK78_07440 [Nocardioides sp.]|uniref:hypothetical protein n=1 Tax=Nocardioides sp. TaxID=35761 RepID=UPI002F3E229D